MPLRERRIFSMKVGANSIELHEKCINANAIPAVSGTKIRVLGNANVPFTIIVLAKRSATHEGVNLSFRSIFSMKVGANLIELHEKCGEMVQFSKVGGT